MQKWGVGGKERAIISLKLLKQLEFWDSRQRTKSCEDVLRGKTRHNYNLTNSRHGNLISPGLKQIEIIWKVMETAKGSKSSIF